jgi:hypothetical protein
MVLGGVGAFKLMERPINMRGSVGGQRYIGRYRSVDALERGIKAYGERVLREESGPGR